jgi:hypothetical protein
MTDAFDDRRRGFEAKWARDADLKFRVEARRNYLLGLWAAKEKGLTGAEAEALAQAVIAADFQEPGEEDVFRKLRAELAASVSDATIRGKMQELLQAAIEQLAKDK